MSISIVITATVASLKRRRSTSLAPTPFGDGIVRHAAVPADPLPLEFRPLPYRERVILAPRHPRGIAAVVQTPANNAATMYDFRWSNLSATCNVRSCTLMQLSVRAVFDNRRNADSIEFGPSLSGTCVTSRRKKKSNDKLVEVRRVIIMSLE
jgi:hypothetical protein